MAAVKKASRLGQYERTSVGGENVDAFIPPPLPPKPALDFARLLPLVEEANQALGRLDGVTSILPDTPLFLYMYVRKEALLSSQIEGTQSSLSDLLLFETEEVPGVPIDDVQEVSSYVKAMNYGLERLRGDFPLSLRLIKEIHEVLLSQGRGKDKLPGEFRKSQNWIGGTRPGNADYVPPPHTQVLPLMGDLEKFLHEEHHRIPTLIKAGLAHVQFETIHPFLDGNGRVGRLLITFMLCQKNVLRDPLLYLSLFFKSHRKDYYTLLQRVRERGDWEGWLEFFLQGVRDTSNLAADTARKILNLFESDRQRLEGLGRAASSTMRVHQLFQTKPMASIPDVAEQTAISQPTVTKAIERMIELGILEEVTGRQRGRVFVYRNYLTLLSEGTDPLPREAD